MVGTPCSIQDSEITCSLPSSYDTSERGTLLTLHVKLSRIMGDIIKCKCSLPQQPSSFGPCAHRGDKERQTNHLTAVYTADSKQRRSFIATVQSVLRDMADILRDIETVSTRTAHPTLRTVSTTTSQLFMLYHQVRSIIGFAIAWAITDP